ncbi:MAG: hypothetical protein ACETWG_08075 [Candidatus Neomarinimicrobiota bacterium]
MRSKWYSFLYGLVLSGFLFGQAQFVVLTPDPNVNQQIKGRPFADVDLLQYAEGAEGLTINPKLPPHWTWIAGRGVTGEGRPVEFFFRNGIMFATEIEVSSFRNQIYPDSFTDKISCGAFTIGIRHDREAVIFVATEEPQDVRLVIDETVFGEEKVIQIPLGAHESQIIRIFPLKEPYRP